MIKKFNTELPEITEDNWRGTLTPPVPSASNMRDKINEIIDVLNSITEGGNK